MAKNVQIQFLFWEDCPSHPQAWRLLQEVLDETGIEATIERIEVVTDEQAEQWQFPGSPTIRINGVDVDAGGASQMGSALTCRVYVLEDGRFSPVPSREMIHWALQRARA